MSPTARSVSSGKVARKLQCTRTDVERETLVHDGANVEAQRGRHLARILAEDVLDNGGLARVVETAVREIRVQKSVSTAPPGSELG